MSEALLPLPEPDYPAGSKGMLDLGPPLQGGLSNAELLDAWTRKLPKVEPSERDLAAFALGVEVGRELGLQAAAQAAQPDDSYQDEWFKAKADAVRRIRALMTPAA